MIPEITIKISMRPEEITISQGQTEISEETFSVPPVPAETETFADEEYSVPPTPEEEVALFTEEEWIAPPEDEETVAGEVTDELPDVPGDE